MPIEVLCINVFVYVRSLKWILSTNIFNAHVKHCQAENTVQRKKNIDSAFRYFSSSGYECPITLNICNPNQLDGKKSERVSQRHATIASKTCAKLVRAARIYEEYSSNVVRFLCIASTSHFISLTHTRLTFFSLFPQIY